MAPESKIIINKNQPDWIKRLKTLIIVTFIYGIFNLFGAGCPIKYFTGISCPGCGMTRAVLAALRLDLRKAFFYHPLFFLVPFMLALYLFGDYIKTIYVKSLWAAIIITFLIVYFLRLLVYPNEVVIFDIQSSFMVKCFKYFKYIIRE